MTDIIEANFTQIKDALQKVKEDVIKAITQEKKKEIAELKADIKAKDVQIQSLMLKEGELKGKDELIANLNKNVDKLQIQLGEQSHHGECHSNVNPLQSVIDTLTAKIYELENEIKSLKEKAAKELQEMQANLLK